MAQARALEILGAAAKGQDLQAEKIATRRQEVHAKPKVLTMTDLLDRFLEEHCPGLRKSTTRTYRLLIDRFIKPAVGSVAVCDFVLGDAGKLHHSMRSTPRSANQALAVLSKSLSLAELWGLRPPNSNPCGAIKRFQEAKRQRYLTPDELQRLEGKLDKAVTDGSWQPAIRALRFGLLTGLRLGELEGLLWTQVNEDRCALIFGALAHKTGSKAGAKIIPLSGPAKAILDEANDDKMLGSGARYVFPGKLGGGCRAQIRYLWDEMRNGETFADVRIHDLRHSFASFGVRAGLSLPQIGGLLGHKAAATTSRYAHLMQDTARKAAEKIAQAMGNLGGGLSKVGAS